MTTVVLVDDHPIVREGIRRLLTAQHGYTVVEETDLGLLGLEAVGRLRPDLAIVDLLLPDLNGIEVTRRMLRASPHTRIVALSMYSDELHVIEALRAGATAYLVKGASAEEILSALREALAGRRYLSAPLTERVIEEYFARAPAPPRKADRYELLTAREREVLDGIVAGRPNKLIAHQLGISPRTVEIYRANVMTKMQANSLSELVRMALVSGALKGET